MKVIPTAIPDLLILEPKVFGDPRDDPQSHGAQAGYGQRQFLTKIRVDRSSRLGWFVID